MTNSISFSHVVNCKTVYSVSKSGNCKAIRRFENSKEHAANQIFFNSPWKMSKIQFGRHWSAIEAAVLTVLTIIVWGLFSLPAVFYFVLADNKVYCMYTLYIFM